MTNPNSTCRNFCRCFDSYLLIALWAVFFIGILPPPTFADGTGLRGQVLRGPVRPGPMTMKGTDEAPFRANFLVLSAGRAKVGQFKSDDDGRFKIILPPGEYTIIPDRSAPLLFPEKQGKKVTVPQEGFLDLKLRFDTGMR